MPIASFRFLLLLLALLASSPAWARGGYWNTSYDSLYRALPQQTTDTARLRTLVHLLDLSELTEARNREQALPLLEELLTLNQKLRQFDARPYQRLQRGVALWVQGTDDARAMAALHHAVYLFDQQRRPIPRLLIDLAPLYNRMHASDARFAFFRRKLLYYRVHDASENAAACYLVLGGSYWHRGDYNQAISAYLGAADLFQHFDRMLYVNEIMVTGWSYAAWGNPQKGLHYLLRALALQDRYQLEGLRRFYTLHALSRLYMHQEQYSDAMKYAELALQTARHDSLDRTLFTAYGLVQKSAILVAQQRLEPAAPLLRQAQQLADSLHLSISGRPGEFMLDATWAQYYAARHDYTRAEQHWRNAYKMAVATHFTVLQPELLRQLIQFYNKTGQLSQSQRYTHAYLALTDSLSAAHGGYKIAQYEAERLERDQNARIDGLYQTQAVQEIRLQQRNLLLGGAAAVVLLVSGLGIVLYRQLRQNRQMLAQLRSTQTQLVAAEKWAFVGEVSAGIAHELQNPLHFMKRFADVSASMLETMQQPAANGPAAPDELEQEILAGLKQNLQEISQHGLRASSIIKDMLAHSRTGTSRRQVTDLNALVQEQLHLAHTAHQHHNPALRPQLTFDPDPHPQAASARLVPQDMARVLLNLFTNAFHALSQRAQTSGSAYTPSLHVSTRRLPQQLEIRVRDNGTGMSEAVRQQIFQPFFTTKAVGEGTGLGLSLSYDIITKGHGGTVVVETQEGQFTEFIITLPA